MRITGISNTLYSKGNSQPQTPKNMRNPAFGRFIVEPDAARTFRQLIQRTMQDNKAGNKELEVLYRIVKRALVDAAGNKIYDVSLSRESEEKFRFLVMDQSKKLVARGQNFNIDNPSVFFRDLLEILSDVDIMALNKIWNFTT